jgi:addiction module HigA family antidote
MRPVHPGEILKEEFLVPFDMSATALAQALKVTPARINEIVRGERGISSETALRLARYFNTTAEFWLNLQLRYDLKCAETEFAKSIETDVKPYSQTTSATATRRG